MSGGDYLARDARICPYCKCSTISDKCERCGQDMNATECDTDKILDELMSNAWEKFFK